jgi:hypothetical protein
MPYAKLLAFVLVASVSAASHEEHMAFSGGGVMEDKRGEHGHWISLTSIDSVDQ